jgi:phosphoribosylformylglycinamidine synthase
MEEWMMVRAMVLAAPGVNCDPETVEAAHMAGAEAELVHLNQLFKGERRLRHFGMLIFPGGFSYGDHLGAGSLLATTLRHRLFDDLQRFIDDGRPVLGICNGFQALARLGLLGTVSLIPNVSQRFVCRWVPLRVEASPCLFLRGLDRLELPVAHGQGRVVIDEGNGRDSVPAPLRYEENPNGSTADIAGVSNERGNVFGLMPHPERYVMPYQHPRWQRQEGAPVAGLALFRNAVRYVKEEL